MRLNLLTGKKWLAMVALLVLVQSVIRLAFLFVDWTPFIEQGISRGTFEFMWGMFLLLGMGGLLFIYPFVKGRDVGLYGILGVSVATILFDIWGMTIQFTAAMGMVVPMIAMMFIAMNREMFTGEEGHEISSGVRY